MIYYLSEPIVMSDYDPRWIQFYVVEGQRLGTVRAPIAMQLQHIGSTAMPGLAAKPSIDISVAVPNLADSDAYVPALGHVGIWNSQSTASFSARSSVRGRTTRVPIICISPCMGRLSRRSHCSFATIFACIRPPRRGISRSSVIRPASTSML